MKKIETTVWSFVYEIMYQIHITWIFASLINCSPLRSAASSYGNIQDVCAQDESVADLPAFRVNTVWSYCDTF